MVICLLFFSSCSIFYTSSKNNCASDSLSEVYNFELVLTCKFLARVALSTPRSKFTA